MSETAPFPSTMDAASRPGRLACVGEWLGRGRTMTIAERGEHMLLEMGPETPSLYVVPSTEGSEVWPMQWSAVRDRPSGPVHQKDALYILELPTPTSPRLLVRRPAAEGCVEFSRADVALPNSTGQVPSRSPKRSRSLRSEARARPGDWGCVKCGFQNFSRNRTCHKCCAPRSGDGKQASDLENLVAKVKRGQRSSQVFKARWEAFCDRHGRGFHDPARHSLRYLQDFLDSEGRLQSRSASRGRRSRSCSVGRRRMRASSSVRSRTRRRRRRERKMRRKHLRRVRRERTRSSSVRSGRQLRSAGTLALRKAESALIEAEKELDRVREAAVQTEDRVRSVELQQQEEVERAVKAARTDAEETLQSRLHSQEQKLVEEKAMRLREAEQRLDKAIAVRLSEAEKRLRRDVDTSVEDARRQAEEVAHDAVEAAERRAQAEAASKVEEATERVQAARAHLATLRDSARPGGAPSRRAGSSSSCSSASPEDVALRANGGARSALERSGQDRGSPDPRDL